MTILDQSPFVPSSAGAAVEQQVDAFFNNLPGGTVVHGLAVGILGKDPLGGGRFYYGMANAEQGTPVSPDTAFEIGSMTKSFTTTMLAAQVVAGNMALNDTAQSYYDSNGPAVTLPVYTDPSTGTGVPMTLLELADFTSGITHQEPSNLGAPNAYTLDLMHAYLENDFPSGLPAEPGTQYDYVNVNFGIIAEVLMQAGGYTTYADMLQAELITPGGLAMPSTGVITSNTPSIPTLAQGYNPDGSANPNFALTTWPALQGAGGIYSTLDDMVEWLRFNMGLTSSPMNDVLSLTHKQWFTRSPGVGQGLGWFLDPLAGTTMISKNGGTNGFSSWISFTGDNAWGVVVLCNGAVASPVSALGTNILRALVDLWSA